MRALVLTGGGSKGAFQVGALKYIMQNRKLDFDIISGVSVGALNAAFLAQYSTKDTRTAITDLESLWLNIETKNIYKRWFPFGKFHALWKNSMYNSKPMRDLIQRSIDTTAINNSGKILQIGSVCADDSLYRIADQNSFHLLDSVKASAAFPMFLEPHSVEPGTLDFDGGIREMAPIGAAIRMGATHITIISADNMRLRSIKSKDLKTLGIAKRCVEIMADEVVNNDVNEFLKINSKIKIIEMFDMKEQHKIVFGDKKYIPNIIIKPQTILTEDSLTFDPEVTKKMLREGYEVAEGVYNKTILGNNE